jgi:mRNA-degrading endonuclease RelE of RelBE toxin-antitoxin system
MPYRIEFADEAQLNLRAVRKSDQVKVIDRIETHLTYQPSLQSRSRIKSLRSGTFPPYRLRVDEFRIYSCKLPCQRDTATGELLASRLARYVAGGRPASAS